MPASTNPDPWSAFAFIALGSNLGDSPRIVAKAIERLRQFSDQPLLASSLWRTDPVDCPPGSSPFINAAVALLPRADQNPNRLLAALQCLEQEFGRTPKVVLNEPRPLDLDLIAYGTLTCAGTQLTLPHPRAHLRRFVLEPLAEIAPGLRLPGHFKPVQQLLDELGPDQRAIRISERL